MYQSKKSYPRVLMYTKLKVIIFIFLQIHIQNKPIYAEQEEKKIIIVKTGYIIHTYKLI